MTSIPRNPEEYREWWAANTDEPYGLCWCGCKQKTPPHKQTAPSTKRFKGEPTRFFKGHVNRLSQGVNLVDRQFGDWVVLRLAPSGRPQYWLCICKCGREKEVDGGSLRSGASKSCGCGSRPGKRLDLTGKKFGKLVARKRIPRGKQTFWECDCECGNTTTVAISMLTTGKTKSCGCLREWSEENSQDYEYMVGQRFGRLVVQSVSSIKSEGRREYRALCQCDCGNTTEVASYNLLRGATKSCGCYFKYMLEGRTFGKLTVLGRAETTPSGHPKWRCRCECGSERVFYATNLYTGTVVDCGCGHEERKRKGYLANTLPEQLALIRRAIWSYKSGARSHKRSFNLSEEHAEELLFSDCHYCGIPPSREMSSTSHSDNSKILINGIDRMDSSRGYEPDNVVACCTRCNYMKRELNHDEFVQRCALIAHRLGE